MSGVEGAAAAELAVVGMRRVAVVGLSDDPTRPSHGVGRELLARGVDVVPVNPSHDTVLGLRSYPDLASVPGRIDVVDVFRRPEHLAGVAREAVARSDVGVVFNQLGLRSPEARQVVLGAGRGYVEDRCLKVDAVRRDARAPSGPRLEAEVVLLDLDDTLLDHDACERGAVAATLEAHGLPSGTDAVDTYVAINEQEWAAYRAGERTAADLRVVRWERTVAALAAAGHVAADAAGADVAAAVDVPALAADYLARFGATAALLPGAAAALWWLSRRARVAVVTNGFSQVQAARLAAAGLDDLVELLVSSEDAGVAKPDPAPLLLALERLGVGATDVRVVMVGDQLGSDVAAGVAAGVGTVWLAPRGAAPPPGAPVPDVHVMRLADLV